MRNFRHEEVEANICNPSIAAPVKLCESMTKIPKMKCDGSLAHKLEGRQRSDSRGMSSGWWKERLLVGLYSIALPG